MVWLFGGRWGNENLGVHLIMKNALGETQAQHRMLVALQDFSASLLVDGPQDQKIKLSFCCC